MKRIASVVLSLCLGSCSGSGGGGTDTRQSDVPGMEAAGEAASETLRAETGPEVGSWSQTFVEGSAGVLEITDPASPLYGFRLEVDADALTTPTLTVTVRQTAAPAVGVGAGDAMGPAVSIEPHGYPFAHAVRLYLPLAPDEGMVPAGGSVLLSVWRALEPGVEAQVEGVPIAVWWGANGVETEGAAAAVTGPVSAASAVPDGAVSVDRVLVLTSGLSEWIPLIYILPDACKTAADCNDYHFCTIDQCVGQKCKWTSKGEGAPCDDADPYTVGETCQEGHCVGKQATCAVDADCQNPPNCHGGWCVEHDCVYSIWPLGTPCDDGKVCTASDACTGTMECTGSPKDCADSDPCTDDGCEEGEGCYHDPAAKGTACDDGNPDTVDDACSDGVCTGMAKECAKDGDCDDQNACTTQTCVDFFCKASAVPEGTPCDDGDSKTSPDKCIGGQCVGYWDECTQDSDCDDKEVCTKDTCETGACFHGAVPGNPPCNDGDPMTIDDECAEGICLGWNAQCTEGDLFNCDDLSPCTKESCAFEPGNIGGKCATEKLSGPPCNDGSQETNLDVCEEGKCVGYTVACTSDEECNDQIPCTKDTCVDPASPDGGQCVHDDGSAACEDNNPCTKDACKPLGCEHGKLSAVPCDDGNDWTDQDSCTDGQCKGVPVKCLKKEDCDSTNVCAPQDCVGGLCTADIGTDGLVCDDSNPCLTKLCLTGKCSVEQPKNGLPCVDGNPANDPDQCWFGACIGTAGGCQESGQCADTNVCTDDLCEAAKCVHKPLSGGECDDLDPSTIDEFCVNGVCKGKPPECTSDDLAACEDSNVCTKESCDVKPGNAGGKCAHEALYMVPCDDGVKLTVDDSCAGGVCKGTPVDCLDATDCDDKNECSSDACVKQEGAAGGTCTYQDVGASVCDDKNPCTEDSCFPGQCLHANVDGVACDDGNPATSDDVCSGGKCAGKPGKACTKPGPNFSECNDGKPCTDDICSADMVCTNKPGNFPVCDDGNPNTTGDHCSGGVCTGAAKSCVTAAECDDKNSCTTDTCPNGTCEWVALHGLMCNDGSPTTYGDMCYMGKCIGGGTCTKAGPCGEMQFKKCSPYQCTNGLCLWFPVNGEACDDLDPCTEADACNNGICKGTPIAGCSVAKCSCGQPGVTLKSVGCTWDNCFDCSGWAGACGQLGVDPYGAFADGTQCLGKTGTGVEIDCP